MKKLLSIFLCLALLLTPVYSTGTADGETVELSHEPSAFDMGNTHSAAIQSGGYGYAWGYNYDGPIGNGSTAASPVTVPYNFAENVAAVSANARTTAFIDTNGTLYLIGEIWWGIGGDTSMPTPYVYTEPYQLATNVRSVSMGFNHLVFVKNDDTLWVYGENAHGQLGTGNTNSSYTPTQRLTNVSYAVAGDCLTVAVKNDGTVYACGFNDYGQVGNNTTTEQKTFVQVTGLSNVYTASCMGDHVMAIKNDNTLWAWGRNDYGQLGNGNTTNQKKAVQVMTGAAQVSAGMYHTGVVKSDGTLWFAGNNWRGEFGSGSTAGYTAANSTFCQTAGSYLAVSCGTHTTAVLSTEGRLYVAGNDTYGQLGNGTTGSSFPSLTGIDVWIFGGPALIGDVNCNGVVTFSDVSLLASYLVGMADLSAQGRINANADVDPALNSADLNAIIRIIFAQ